MKRILITGGAGFVGSSLAIRLKAAFPETELIAFDNLKRRGSELSLARLRDAGVSFVHGDVRVRSDFESISSCDLLLDCAAEPSVLAGLGASPDYVVETNLNGTINCLEWARRWGSQFILLSTSRVYPMQALGDIALKEDETRFVIEEHQVMQGVTPHGISEGFSLQGARSLYGASKLCSELLVTEYIHSYGLQALINRCGVLAGPWQMGKVDQGVVVLWVAKHFFGKELAYIGYGGSGKQVRDMLHVDDLFELLLKQIPKISECNGEIFNVGGGNKVSLSLRELTELSIQATGKRVPVRSIPENRANDIPLYITDYRKVSSAFAWEPRRGPSEIIQEITDWIGKYRVALEPILA